MDNCPILSHKFVDFALLCWMPKGSKTFGFRPGHGFSKCPNRVSPPKNNLLLIWTSLKLPNYLNHDKSRSQERRTRIPIRGLITLNPASNVMKLELIRVFVANHSKIQKKSSKSNQLKSQWFWVLQKDMTHLHMKVSENGGTPSYHPFIDGIFPHKPSSYGLFLWFSYGLGYPL